MPSTATKKKPAAKKSKPRTPVADMAKDVVESVPKPPGPARLAAKAVTKMAGRTLRKAAESARSAVSGTGGAATESLLARARSLPIQRSVDVAVPIDVAWDHWMDFEFLPEGTHRVADVERDDDDHLVGHIRGVHMAREWEAEIVDERIDESFAWHSMGSSDTSGLVTFHELGERLTRIELHLDVIPGGVADAVALVLRVADRRADAELRRFKAEVEAIDPDEYPPPEDVGDDDVSDEDVDGDEDDGADFDNEEDDRPDGDEEA
jgi:uncharacterized membrane protein